MVINGLGQVRFFPVLLKDFWKDEEKTGLSIVRYRCMLAGLWEHDCGSAPKAVLDTNILKEGMYADPEIHANDKGFSDL